MPPEAIAPLVVYLCTDAAQNINGRDFAVMGQQIGLYTIPSLERVAFSSGPTWTLDELDERFQQTLGQGLTNQFGPREQPAAAAS